ncbi:MAG TPA: TonB-dependent receptor [Terriglobales bacterium]|nr:TonB-dependent receptor [Terriglobales bacterium]
MLAFFKKARALALPLIVIFASTLTNAQSGNSTSINGTVLDPSGAVVSNATVEIHNPVSGFSRTVTTDAAGKFTVPNVPFNPYHLNVTGKGFIAYTQDVDVRSIVPVTLTINLKVAGNTETVTVEANGADLLENTSTFHTDVDRGLFDKMPLESQSSSVSSLVTLSSPGIAADSNGLFHGMGDHAENSFVVDGQPITDQQSKVFSNQIPLDSVASMEVISGAPPAEYGEKTSVVINATTRSGQGLTTPTGSLTSSYGSFGTSTVGFNLGYGGQQWGNFISASGLNTGRFLDTPEFTPIHAKGNEENIFDRIDYRLSTADSVQVNLGFTRSWFQNPNSFDNVLHLGQTDPSGNPLNPTDQRSQIRTFNIAPSWTRLINANSVLTLGAFVRHDQYNYYPSHNLFDDLSAIQQETVAQDRTLTNAGLRASWSYIKGAHNIKVGATYQQTLLNENDNLGIIDTALLPSLTDEHGNPCFVNGTAVGPPCSDLLPFDLTRAGGLFDFRGHTDVKQLALYVQDQITKGNWSFNVGLRGDFYNGLVTHKEAEPRIGLAYNIKPSGTVLRLSYARVLETPFNENLIIASDGCDSPVLNPLLGCSAVGTTPLSPGWRNEFHAGLEQAFGKYLVFSGEYVWKYTHNAYDFSILGNTPIFFPIAWDRSKIPGFAGRVSVPDLHGFSALMVFSTVSARFFLPQVSGAGETPAAPGGVFRIDHDERFNETTHLQYQIRKNGPWLGFNWRYDSGMVAGAVPFAADTTTPVDLSGLTADQQMQAGLFCGNALPSLGAPLTTCAPSQYGSSRVTIPVPGTENDDHNPPRIAPRHVFDLAIGDDDIFRGDKYKWSLRLTAINLTNKVALYNFLSTFSGTHFLTPRTYTAEIGFHF